MRYSTRSSRALIYGCAFLFVLINGAVVHAQGTDVTPPNVVSIDFTPTVIVDSAGTQPVTFTVQITDNASGFQSASWRLVSPSANHFHNIGITATNRISGSSLDGIYATIFDLPPHSETGTWHVANMRVTDIAGNIRVYDDMPAYNSPALFTANAGISRVFARDFNLDSITDIAVIAGTTATVYLGSGNGTFGTGITSTIGSDLQGGLIGDFNGDGIPDFAFWEPSDVMAGVNPVGVMFGNGNGTFQPYRTVGAMPYETPPYIGDFDGDGKSDMAGAGSWGGIFDGLTRGIIILSGRSDGNFDRTVLGVDLGQSTAGHNFFTADFNGDGIPDLVWGKYYSNTTGTLLVMLGQGNRTFGSPIENTSVGRPAAYASADFNGDGHMDLAVKYGGNPWGGDNGNTGILYGNGDGTFQPVALVSSLNSIQLSVADLDRDGRPDLAAISGDGFQLLTNNGDGTFRQYILTAGVNDHYDWSDQVGYGIADFNYDGRTDFVVAWNDGKGGVYLGIPATAVTLAQSNPTSTFEQTITLTATVTPSDLLGPVTFYDGANVIGSALLQGGQAVFATGLLGTGTHALSAAYRGTLMGSPASFSPAIHHTVSAGLASSRMRVLDPVDPGFIPARLAAGDFNKDGKADLVATDYYFEGTTHVFLGNGNGTFPPAVTYINGWSGNRFIVRPVVIGDWNQDGNLDLETGTETGTYEYKGNGDGTFQEKRGVPGWPLLGDVNRDGTLDRVFVNGSFVSVILGKGDRDGRPMSSLISSTRGANGQSDIAMGDFDGDGNLDVAVTAQAGNLLNILLGNGDGTFQPPMTITTGTGPICPVIVDFNGDGKLDLAFIEGGSGTIRILLGEGDGSFLAPIAVALGGTLTRMIAADVNGDGTPDLVVLSQTLDRVLVLPGNGNGTFGSAQMYFTSTYPSDVVAADFNGDGRMDLAVASRNNWSDGRITILLSVNPGPTSVALSVSTSLSTLSQEVTMTATVGPSGATGWVTFYDGATPLGSAQIVAGQAVFHTRLLSSGNHLLRAVFSGDGTVYGSSFSSVKSHKVTASSVFAYGPMINLHAGLAAPVQTDLNGDGKVDLVVVNGGYVTILLGQGDGQFSAGTPYGPAASKPVAADFNHDGQTDVLVGNFLYLGKGDGTLENAKTLPTLAGSVPTLAVDFNADGAPDLIDFSTFRVFMNRGDGTFESPIQINLSSSIRIAAVGDLNGDGRPDIVALDSSAGNAYVLMGKGDGTFLSPVSYATVGSPNFAVIGEFNGDGIPDLAVSSENTNRVGIMLGLGPGTFENWGDAIKGSAYVYLFDTCDCDGDGKTDLLTFGIQKVTLLRGLGDGTFQDGIEYVSSPDHSWPQFLTDLNGDGRPDLVLWNTQSIAAVRMAVYPSSVSLAMTPNPVKLSEAVMLTATLTPSDATGTVAFYDDAIFLGKTTIAGGQAVLQTKWLGAGVHKLRALYSGDPLRYIDSVSANVSLTVAAGRSGGFGAGTTFATARGPKGVAAGDLSGDGKQDLVIANTTSNTISVLMGNGDGTFATRVSYNTGSAPVAVAITDLNGDGKLDVAVANSGSNNISILLGNGDGTLQQAVNYVIAGSPRSLFAADLNNDQYMDLAIGTTNGAFALLGAGGAFSVPFLYDGFWIGVGAADLNNDGRADIPVASAGGSIAALLQGANWTFSPTAGVGMGTAPSGLAMGDFNGDGKLDLATANTGSNNASVALGKGDGTFQTAVSYAAGTGPVAIVATDCNGDGKLDLVVVNGTGNSITLLKGKGNGTFFAGIPVTTGGTPAGVVAADFNGDGVVDLAVTNSADNTVSVYLGRKGSVSNIDFDGDGKSSPVVYRSGIWYVQSSISPGSYLATQWGMAGDVPVAGDYDGDGTTDIAVWRPSNGIWYILPSATPGSYLATQWGIQSDVAAAGDYDGDGKTDIAVWRPSSGVWYVQLSGTPGSYTANQWGLHSDVPVSGDFDGDGKTDVAVWRPSSGVWYALLSGTPGAYTANQWGISSDMPVPGDFDGDGMTDMAVWRPASGVWYVQLSGTPGSYLGTQWGLQTDKPVGGDFDGDGKTDIAVWRPDTGIWYVLPSATPGSYTATQWGISTDAPVN